MVTQIGFAPWFCPNEPNAVSFYWHEMTPCHLECVLTKKGYDPFVTCIDYDTDPYLFDDMK